MNEELAGQYLRFLCLSTGLKQMNVDFFFLFTRKLSSLFAYTVENLAVPYAFPFFVYEMFLKQIKSDIG